MVADTMRRRFKENLGILQNKEFYKIQYFYEEPTSSLYFNLKYTIKQWQMA